MMPRANTLPSRAAFTLIEIMVSLMIFSVVSTAMIGILFTASELYRRGESSRSAQDESVTVLATFEDDLSRLVPERDGGWLHAEVLHNNGSMLIGMLITNADPGRVQVQANHIRGRRRMVYWWADANDDLRRAEADEPFDTDATTDRASEFSNDLTTFLGTLGSNGAGNGRVITTGCLHFSLIASMPRTPRDRFANWEPSQDANLLPSLTGAPIIYDSFLDGFAETVAIRTILTGGGRFAPNGSVIDDTGSAIRYTGVRGVASIPGSLARIGTGANSEWVGYRGGGGTLNTSEDSIDGTGRARLYSVGITATRGDPIRFGMLSTLVRGLPR